MTAQAVELEVPPASAHRPAAARPSELQEIIGFLRIEAEQLRQRVVAAENSASEAMRQRDEAIRKLAAVEGELLGTKQSRDDLHATVDKLAHALQVATDRAAAENRQNLVRVDQARKEGREEAEVLRTQLRAAEAHVEALAIAKQQSDDLAIGLRQALAAEKLGRARS